MSNKDMQQWKVCDPDIAEDQLPLPYRLIDQVLQQTIIYQLDLAMFDIEQRKKNVNFQGTVQQYLANNYTDIGTISCFSSYSKRQNHLLMGDQAGNIYIFDLAKKSIFDRKELVAGKRVIDIGEFICSDGQTSIDISSICLRGHQGVFIVMYKLGLPKLSVPFQVRMSDSQNINDLPYLSRFEDGARLLWICTYGGSMHLFRIPSLHIEINKQSSQNHLQIEQQQMRKILQYPLRLVQIDNPLMIISKNCLSINFQGYEKSLNYQQMLEKLKQKNQVVVNETQPIIIKKDIKKGDKKQQIVNEVNQNSKDIKKQILFNKIQQIKQTIKQNGHDKTENYILPKFKPFLHFLYKKKQFPKKKYFEKSSYYQIPTKIIYGWLQTKQFFIAELQHGSNCATNYQQISYFQEQLSSQRLQKDKNILTIQMSLKNKKKFKNIFLITCTQLSQPNEQILAVGMSNGSIGLWNTNTMTLEATIDKHQGSITIMKFFEIWKLISGSQKGEIYIYNLVQNKIQMKRTNTFEPKEDIPITNIEVSKLGIAFVTDAQGNFRAYDFWRAQKIARINPCSNFAFIENKGKKWISSQSKVFMKTVYCNWDFTLALSMNWPNLPSILDDSQQNITNINYAENLKKNPWISTNITVHIIRNFQFLRFLFDGLENNYKKGYDRRQIENLFSNLEFQQLYDRHFNIPNFGHISIGSKKQIKSKQLQLNPKSSESSFKSKNKSSNKDRSNKKLKLTNEVLHPEKILLERRKIPNQSIVNEEILINQLREQHHNKVRRQIILQNQIGRDTF